VTAAVWELEKLLREMRKGLNRVTAPALLIYSKSDHTVTLPNSRSIYEGLSSGQKELVILEESNHNITIHTEHRLVFQTVSNFITENR
jgi:carboxylesterase